MSWQSNVSEYSYDMTANTEINKKTIISMLFKVFLITIITISSAFFYNAATYDPNIILDEFPNTHNKTDDSYFPHFNQNSFIMFEKYKTKNFIFVSIENQLTKSNLFLKFIFYKDSLNLKISNNSSLFNEKEILTNEKDKLINDANDSIISVHFFNFPFNFYVYRLGNTTHSLFDTRTKENFLIKNDGTISLTTSLNNQSVIYGLERDRKFLLSLSVEENVNKKLNEIELNENNSFIMINSKETLKAFAFFVKNSKKVKFEKNLLTFEGNDVLSLFILDGGILRENIILLNGIDGDPIKISHKNLNWFSFEEEKESDSSDKTLLNYDKKVKNCIFSKNLQKSNQNLFKNFIFDLDEIEIQCTDIQLLNKNTNISENKLQCFLNEINNKLIEQKTTNFTMLILITSKSNQNFIPLINNLNSLISKLYNNDTTILINQHYHGLNKQAAIWENEAENIEDALFQTLQNTIKGNVYSAYSVKCDSYLDIQSEYNFDKCLSWIEMTALMPFAIVNSLNDLLTAASKHKHEHLSLIENALMLRYRFHLYIYTYMIKTSMVGGSLIRPLSFDFISKTYFEVLNDVIDEFMLASVVLVIPKLQRSYVFFPSDYFIEIDSGERGNKEGRGFYKATSTDKQLTFIREGYSLPLLIIDKNVLYAGLADINVLKTVGIELFIALDSNFRSYGRIYQQNNEKGVYYMEIKTYFMNNALSIIFHHFNPYNLVINQEIRIIQIYNFNKFAVNKMTKITKVGAFEINRNNMFLDVLAKKMKIEGLNINLNEDTKIVIS